METVFTVLIVAGIAVVVIGLAMVGWDQQKKTTAEREYVDRENRKARERGE